MSTVKQPKQAQPRADETEYKEFVEKFKPKLTTDDCYTPDNVYEAVASWVAEEYGLDRSRFVRPFWPGRNYQKDTERYGPDTVVVDNPPFSIFSQIMRFYQSHGVKFFLFGPALTLFSAKKVPGITFIPVGCTVTFKNGAEVAVSFATNLDSYQIRTAPELYSRVLAANNKNLEAIKKHPPKYTYPDHVVTAALAQKWCHYGVDYRLAFKDCVQIEELDAMKAKGKKIFGKGFLLSDRAAAERAATERAAAERAAAERWQLSEREWEIVKNLGKEEMMDAEKSICRQL